MASSLEAEGATLTPVKQSTESHLEHIYLIRVVVITTAIAFTPNTVDLIDVVLLWPDGNVGERVAVRVGLNNTPMTKVRAETVPSGPPLVE